MSTNTTRRPNIVFVFADQLRYDSLGCDGNRVVQTPNIGTLARDGVTFDGAFSATPICSPYRAQILTGNYAHTNGVICNEFRLVDNQSTLPQILRPFGYRSAYVGKWHLGYGPYHRHKRYGDYPQEFNIYDPPPLCTLEVPRRSTPSNRLPE